MRVMGPSAISGSFFTGLLIRSSHTLQAICSRAARLMRLLLGAAVRQLHELAPWSVQPRTAARMACSYLCGRAQIVHLVCVIPDRVRARNPLSAAG